MTRGKYQGVTEILSYNRGFYFFTLLLIFAVLIASPWLPVTVRFIAFAGVATAVSWAITSLAVSHYVYDRSPLYSFSWLNLRPENWVTIHAGLDQTTGLLREKYPQTRSTVFGIFDPEQMTEPSIQRARRLSGANCALEVSWRNLPSDPNSFDTVFLIFAAHELRSAESRAVFFREIARVLKPNGAVILVEHLRNLPNFLAYGPGFLHFHSRATWRQCFDLAGLAIRQEQSITPFVQMFELSHR